MKLLNSFKKREKLKNFLSWLEVELVFKLNELKLELKRRIQTHKYTKERNAEMLI